MALTGTLADAPLDELASMLQQQNRTGRLTLAFPDGRVVLLFREGRVCQVDDERRKAMQKLGELLIAAGCIERTELAAALEEQRRGDKPIGALLVGRGAVGIADLHRYLDLQFRESLTPLFGETGGAFEFDPSPVPPRACAPPSLGVDDLLMEAARRLDELPGLLETVPSPEARVRRLRETLVLPADGDLSERIREAESRVFLAVEGKTPIAELVGKTGLPTFEVMKAAALLARAGLVEISERAASGAQRATPTTEVGVFQRRPGLMRPLLHLVLGMVLTAALLLLVSHVYMARFWEPEGVGPEQVHHDVPPTGVLRTNAHLRRLRAIIEAYRLERGGYPPTLATLVEDGQLAQADLSWPYYRETYYYRPTAEGFVLLPPKR